MRKQIYDRSKTMVNSWKNYFHPVFVDTMSVEFIHDNFINFMEKHDRCIDAVVSPANAYGLMDGGYDAAITEYFGRDLQLSIQNKIIEEYFGEQPVGTSISIKIPNSDVLLIHTPTMRTPSAIKDPTIIYQCMRTTLIEAIKNKCESVVIPAFGGQTGRLNADVIAKMMYLAYLQICDNYEKREINWGNALEQASLLKKYLEV